MNGHSFIRYEEKYLVTDDQKRILEKYLNKNMSPDKYSRDGNSYQVMNLYFDTPDNNSIRESISKPKYKQKLRIRSYHPICSGDDHVYLEIKKKDHGHVNKRRVSLPYASALDFIYHHKKPLIDGYLENQIIAEIEYFIHQSPLIPAFYIQYSRLAFHGNDAQYLRITFDANIIYRCDDLDITVAKGKPLLRENIWLMEIKSEVNYPLWLVWKLSELKLHDQSFSKVGMAYKNKIIGEFS